MKTFIVSYLSFFDNVMKMEKIQGSSAEKVLQDYLYGDEAENFRNMSIEDLEEYAFDCDSAIGIMEV